MAAAAAAVIIYRSLFRGKSTAMSETKSELCGSRGKWSVGPYLYLLFSFVQARACFKEMEICKQALFFRKPRQSDVLSCIREIVVF